MELCVSTYSLSRWRAKENKKVEHCIDWLASIGLTAIEFSGLGENYTGDPIRRARALRKRCEKHGMKVASYCVGAELLVPEKKQRKVVDQLKEQIDIAAELGAPSMRHDVTRGPQPDQRMTLNQVLKAVAPAVRELAEYGQEKGVKTSLENHGFYLQTADRVEKLIQKVDHPNYGLTIDLGNFLCLDQDAVAATKQLAKYVVMAHAKDFYVRPKRTLPPAAPAVGDLPELGCGWFATPKSIALRGAIVGQGVLDLPAQIKILKRAKYDGFLSLEFEGMEDPRDAVRLGLAYLRELV